MSDNDKNNILKQLQKEKTEHNKNKKHIELLKKTINNLTNSKTNKNNKSYADILSENLKLKEEINSKNSNLIENEQKIRSLTAMNENLSEKNNNLETEINNLNLKISKLNNEISQLEEYRSDVLNTNNIKNLLNQEKIKNESISNILNEKNLELIDLKNKNEEYLNEIKELRKMKYDDKLLLYEKDNLNLKQENENKNLEIINLNHKIENFEKNNNEINELLNQQNIKIDNYKNDIANLEIQLQSKEKNFDILSKEKSDLILKNTENIKTNDNYKEKICELTNCLEKYEQENKNLTTRINYLNNDKEKSESYYLNQISLLQKEKNSFEDRLNKLLIEKEMENNYKSKKENLNDENVTVNKYFKALEKINIYQKDNKKLYEMLKQQNIEFEKINKENNFFINLLQNIIQFHISKSEIKNLFKKLIEIFLDKQNLISQQNSLNNKLDIYSQFINTMNNNNNNNNVDNLYDKNLYNQNDFSNVSQIQNSILNIYEKIRYLDNEQNQIINTLNSIQY